MSSRPVLNTTIPLGIGYYTVPEAARLLRIRSISIRRWLCGYSFMNKGRRQNMPPLWSPQIPAFDRHIELGFRDLIELRFVAAFMDQGVGLRTIRTCLNTARELVRDDRPFSTRRFKTDGRTIFIETIERQISEAGDRAPRELLDLRKRQYAFATIVEKSFKDLDFDHDIVARWRPFRGKASIVVDPARAFGQPIANDAGVPTIALAEALQAEGSEKRVGFLYDLPIAVVRDAVQFESELAAA